MPLLYKRFKFVFITHFLYQLHHYAIICSVVAPILATEGGCPYGNDNLFFGFCHGKDSWLLYLQMVRQERQ